MRDGDDIAHIVHEGDALCDISFVDPDTPHGRMKWRKYEDVWRLPDGVDICGHCHNIASEGEETVDDIVREISSICNFDAVSRPFNKSQLKEIRRRIKNADG